VIGQLRPLLGRRLELITQLVPPADEPRKLLSRLGHGQSDLGDEGHDLSYGSRLGVFQD
jgi:hypothetical protein